MDKLFLNRSDFDDFRDISENIDIEKLDTYIRDAQVFDLRTFVGDRMYLIRPLAYNDVKNEFNSTPLTSLWFGEDYDGVRYYGLKPMVIQYTYARLLENIGLNVTRTGVKTFTDETSEAAEKAELNAKIVSARSRAEAYAEIANKYIVNKYTDYPDFEGSAVDKTGMRFFKIGADL